MQTDRDFRSELDAMDETSAPVDVGSSSAWTQPQSDTGRALAPLFDETAVRKIVEDADRRETARRESHPLWNEAKNLIASGPLPYAAGKMFGQGEGGEGVLGTIGQLDDEGRKSWIADERQTAEGQISFWDNIKRNHLARLKEVGKVSVDYSPAGLVAGVMGREGPTLGDDFGGWLDRKVTENITTAKRRMAMAQEMEAGTKPGPKFNSWRASYDDAMRALGETGANVLKGVAYGVETGDLPGFFPTSNGVRRGMAAAGYEPSTISKAQENAIYAFAAYVDVESKRAFPKDEARREEFREKLAGGAGNMIAFMGMGYASMAMGGGPVMATITSGMTGGLAQAGSMTDEALKKYLGNADLEGRGLTPDEEQQATLVWLSGLGIGATEALPLANFFAGHGGRFVRGVLLQATEEGGQEWVQTVLENAVAQRMYDPQRRWDDNAWDGMAVGAILGAKMEAARGVGNKLRSPKPDEPKKDNRPPAPAPSGETAPLRDVSPMLDGEGDGSKPTVRGQKAKNPDLDILRQQIEAARPPTTGPAADGSRRAPVTKPEVEPSDNFGEQVPTASGPKGYEDYRQLDVEVGDGAKAYVKDNDDGSQHTVWIAPDGRVVFDAGSSKWVAYNGDEYTIEKDNKTGRTRFFGPTTATDVTKDLVRHGGDFQKMLDAEFPDFEFKRASVKPAVSKVLETVTRKLAEGKVPTFAELMGVLPKDERGDPDMGVLVGELDKVGVRAWNALNDDQRRQVYETFAPVVEQAAPVIQQAVEAIAGQAGIVSTSKYDTGQSVEWRRALDRATAKGKSPQQIFADAAADMRSRGMEPPASGQSASAPVSTADLRTAFDRVLSSRTKRADWAKTIGASKEQLDALVNEALADGRLKKTKAGGIARTGKKVEAKAAGPANQSTTEWMADRDARIQASKAQGNRHLDTLDRSVEGMRGVEFFNVHDPKERGVVRTVANTGDVVVNWSDKYSADKNLVESKTKDGRSEVWQSWLAPTDLKDYVAATGQTTGQPSPESPSVPTLSPGQQTGRTMDRSAEKRLEAVKSDVARRYASRLIEAGSDLNAVESAIKAMQQNSKVGKAVLAEIVKAYGGVAGKPKTPRAAYGMIRAIAAERAARGDNARPEALPEPTGGLPEAGVPDGIQPDAEVGPAGEAPETGGVGSGGPLGDAGVPDAQQPGSPDGVRGEGAGPGSDTGTDTRPDQPGTDLAAPADAKPNLGVSEEELAAIREQAAADRIREAEERAARTRSNYRITEEDAIGSGGPKAKIRANLAAIETLKQIEEENRPATEDEKKILVKYVGWGAFSQPMFADYNKEFAKERARLQNLMTPEEYKSARASTINAHYTSPDVIKGMWTALGHLGFKGGRVLEPSAGIGHFIGMQPDAMRETSQWTAVELDTISGRITKALYGGADVRIGGFEAQTWPDDHFDLAISNVPFDKTGPSDPRYKTPFSLHDYFFVKALDKVRPGGIVAFITSSYSMDKTRDVARREMEKRGTFLGAIRLPGGNQGAFKANAGTDVTTDIIFFRKRLSGEPVDLNSEWRDLVEIKTPEGPTQINGYFAAHPEMMLGKMRLIGSMYSKGEPVLIGPTSDIDQRIAEAAQNMPADAMLPAETSATALAEEIDTDLDASVKEGAFYLKDGEIYRRVIGVGVPQKLSKPNADRVRSFMGLRDLVDQLFAAQGGQRTTPEQRNAIRSELSARYDEFVKKFGPINLTHITERVDKKGKTITTRRRPNFSTFEEDPSAYKVAAIELYDEKSMEARKAAIFTEDVIAPYKRPTITGPADALAVSLNETGRVDMKLIAEQLGVSEDEAPALMDDSVFLNPKGEQWQTATQYLAGDVVQKLEDAKAAVANGDQRYQKNVDALAKVQPEPLTRVEITVPMGASWVPTEVYEDFVREVMGVEGVSISLNDVTKKWRVSWTRRASGSYDAAQAQWGTDNRSFLTILEATLNSTPIRIETEDADGNKTRDIEAEEAIQAKSTAIYEAFTGQIIPGAPAAIDGWIWQDEERAQRLEALYNQSYNRIVKEQHDGSHLTFPGLAKVVSFPDGSTGTINLTPARTSAIWRIIQNGNTLIDHVVGAGKTWTSIMAVMEMKRLGQIRRPMFVVPNHMLHQFSHEFLQAYPSAKILVADKDSMSKDKRKEFAAKAAAEKWDGIIITHSAFGRIRMQDQAYKDYYEEAIAEMVEAKEAASREEGKGGATVKDIEKAIKALKAKLEKLTTTEAKDDGITFEELGVDHLTVDEAHKFKKLWFMTRHTRVRGLPKKESQRATDLYIKIRHLEKSRPGRSALFLTGTPLSNSMAEIYTMMRFLQHDTLKEYGIGEFDSWAQTFGRIVTKTELAPNGRTFRDATSFSSFVNIPELSTLYGRIADTQTAESLKLPRPTVKGGGPVVVASELSEGEEKYIQSLIQEMENLKGQKPVKGAPNFLSMFTQGLQIGTDMRLVNPDAPFNPKGKIAKATENILRIWQAGNADSKTPNKAQLVFLDMGVPGSKGKASVAISPAAEGGALPPDIEDVRQDIVSAYDVEQETDADEDADADDPNADAKPATEEDAEAKAMLVGKYNLYADIKRRLVAGGVPAEQIEFIHDANTDDKKAKLFEKVRNGDVRILLGSSEKMGVGTNVQKRLIALHHIDSPWTPAEVEQRDGRILRQGNLNKEIEIYRYVTKRSFDSYRWQILETKSNFIGQFRAGARGVRIAEEIDAPLPEAAELKAAATGDPRIVEHADLSRQVRILTAQQSAHAATAVRARQAATQLRKDIEHWQKFVGPYEMDALRVTDLSGDNFKVTINGAGSRKTEVTKRKDAGEAIKRQILSLAQNGWYSREIELELGTISGFEMGGKVFRNSEGTIQLSAHIKGTEVYKGSTVYINEETNPVSLVQIYERLVKEMPSYHQAIVRSIAKAEKDLPRLDELAKGSVFPKQADLDAARKRLDELGRALKPATGASKPVVEEDAKSLHEIVNPIDPKASPEEKLRQIAALTAENKPILDAQLRDMDAMLGTTSNANVKKDETILSKASRPSILAEKPWHGVEHIRDTLRFQTKISDFSQIEKAAEVMLSHGYSIVKIDTKKMLAPKEWGWRFAGFDLRAPNGQLLEWYIIFDTMYAAKKKGHLIFEKWRNETAETRNEREAEYAADVKESYRLYQNAFEDGLRNSGYSGLEDAAADIAKLSASLPVTAAKFSAMSSGPGRAGPLPSPINRQGAASLGRNQLPASPSTMARPDLSSNRTTGGLSDFSIESTSTDNIGGEGANSNASAIVEAFNAKKNPPGTDGALYALATPPRVIMEDAARRAVMAAVKAGKAVELGEKQKQALRDAMARMPRILPDGTRSGFVVKVAPNKAGSAKPLRAWFELSDGSTVSLDGTLDSFIGNGAAFLPSRNGGLVLHFVYAPLTEDAVPTLTGRRWHEAIHAIYTAQMFDPATWGLLVGHADSIGVLDMPLRAYLTAIGEDGSGAPDVSLRDAYTKAYKPRMSEVQLQDALEQESVAIMTELMVMGVDLPLPENIRSILAGIERGEFAGTAGMAEPGLALAALGGNISPADFASPQHVARQALAQASAAVANDEANVEFRSKTLQVAGFVQDWVVPAEGESATATSLYEAYAEWAEALNGETVALPTFTSALNDLGLAKQKIAGRVRYIGVKVLPEGQRPSSTTSVRNSPPLPEVSRANAQEISASVRKGRGLVEAIKELITRLASLIRTETDPVVVDRLLHARALERAVANENDPNGKIIKNVVPLFALGGGTIFSKETQEAKTLSRHFGATRIEDIGPNDPHPGRVLAFHATEADFDQFRIGRALGVHFGTAEQANRIARLYSDQRDDQGNFVSGTGTRLIPAVLDLDNVVDLYDLDNWRPDTVAKEIEFIVPELKGLVDAVGAVAPEVKNDVLRNRLIDQGFSGLRYQNRHESDGGWSYIVWEPGKVISATSGNMLFALGGIRAETADLDALATAETMEAAGEPRESIWDTTGWFRGVDGKWRFEIDDSQATVASTPRKRFRWARVHEGVSHPDLFAAYPDVGSTASSIKVYADDVADVDGALGEKTWSWLRPLRRTEAAMVVGANAVNIKRVTMHELQHRIQQIEGFARGGSAAREQPVYDGDEVDKALEVRNDLLRTLEVDNPEQIPANVKMSETFEDEEVSKLLAQIEDVIDSAGRLTSYLRRAGEVEARAVERRSNMSPAERRARPPWLDYDVPESQQTVDLTEGGIQDSRLGISSDLIDTVSIDSSTGQSMRRDLDSLGFYSKALEAARGLKQEKGTPEQMLAQLKKAGVKDAEIEATGLADLFREKDGSTTALESDAITLPPKRVDREDFEKVGKSVPTTPRDVGPYDLIANYSGGYVRYYLVEKGVPSQWDDNGDSRAVGAFFVKPGQNGGVEVTNARIQDEDMQRKGVGTRVYDLIQKDFGSIPLMPSPWNQLSPNAVSFWAKRDRKKLEWTRQQQVESYEGDLYPDRIIPQQQGDRTASPPRRALLKQITKAEIVKHLEENRVGLREVNYSGDMAALAREADALSSERERLGKRFTNEKRARLAEINAELDRRSSSGEKEVKWQRHSLDPSNPTYRETVIHLPASKPDFAKFKAESLANGVSEAEIERNYQRLVSDPARMAREDSTNFQSGHFPEPNIVGHMMTSMVKHEGKPTYLIDQIQSDWGQKLRDGGVRDEAKIKALRNELAVIGSRSTGFTETPAWIAADEFLAKIGEARLGETAYDDTIDVLRDVARGQTNNEYPDDIRSQANHLAADFKDENQRRLMVEAELATANASSPGHPLVNTTDQWTQTTLRRAIRQAVEAGAEYIAIPTGNTVLSYNPGDEDGMAGFYGDFLDPKEVGIVPKNLRNLLQKIDKSTPPPTRVEKLETPSGMKGEGFTLFPLTDSVKRSVMEDGQPMFALGGFRPDPEPAGEGSLDKVIQDLKDTLGVVPTQTLMGVTIRAEDGKEVRLNPRSNVRGQTTSSTGAVGVRKSRDLQAIAHETAHYLETTLGAEILDLQRDHQADLMQFYDALPDQQFSASEAFAEFFRTYLTNPEGTVALAPDLVAAIEDVLEANGMLDGIHDVQASYQQWRDRATPEQLASDVVSIYKGNTWSEIAEDKAFDNIPGKMAMAYTHGSDMLNPIWHIGRKLLELGTRNGVTDPSDPSKPLSIKVAEDPYKRARMFPGSYNYGYSLLTKGISNRGEEAIAFRPLTAALEVLYGSKKYSVWNGRSGAGTNLMDRIKSGAKRTLVDPQRALSELVRGNAANALYLVGGQYLISKAALRYYDELERKQSRLAEIDELLEQGSEAWRQITSERQKVADKLARRQDESQRLVALSRERRNALQRQETRLLNLQERIEELQNDIADAETNQDVALADRRRNSLAVTQRDLRLAVTIRNQAIDRFQDVESRAAVAATEIAELTAEVESHDAKLSELSTAISGLRKERVRTEKNGASRDPTKETREWHEDFIAKAESDPKYARIKEFADIVHEFAHGLLTRKYQAGFIDKDEFDYLSRNKDAYVPLMRDMTDASPESVFFRGSEKTWSPFKKRDGSDRAIINPLESIAADAYAFAAKEMRNDATLAMIALAENSGPGSASIVQVLNTEETMEANERSFERIKAMAMSMGIPERDATLIVHQMEENYASGEITAVWSPATKGPVNIPTIPAYRNGQRILMRFTDPEWGVAAYEAFSGLGREMQGRLATWLAFPARLLTLGITSNPGFILLNFLRDVQQGYVLEGAPPIITHIRGFTASRDPKFMRPYMEAGGITGGRNVNMLTQAEHRLKVLELAEGKPDPWSTAFGVSYGGVAGLAVGGPMGGIIGAAVGGVALSKFDIRKLVDAVEQSFRLGVAVHAYKRALIHNPSLSPAEAMMEAAYVARNIFDWNRRGSKMMAWTHTTTFLNSAVQGLSRSASGMRGDTDRGSVLAKRLKMVWQRESGITLTNDEEQELAAAYKLYGRWAMLTALSVAAYAVATSGDDDDDDRKRYEDIRDKTKNVRWWFPNAFGSGYDVKIPKPFEWALPGNYIEIIADGIRGRDPRVWDRIVDSTFDVLGPPVIPEYLKLGAGTVLNQVLDEAPTSPLLKRILGRDPESKPQRQIVSDELRALDPDAQFDAYTSQLSIDLSRAIAAAGVPRDKVPSPKMIDFVARTGGMWASDIQKGYQFSREQLGYRQRESMGASDIPVIGAIVGVAARQSRSRDELMRLMSKSGGELVAAAETYKIAMNKRGDLVDATARLMQMSPDERAYALLKYHGSPGDVKRHPLERLVKVDGIASAIRREIILDALAPDHHEGNKLRKDWSSKITLPPRTQKEVHDILARLQQAEAWNSMVAMDRPGWVGKKEFSVQPILDELNASSPEVFEIFNARVSKAKVVDFDEVRNWRDKRDKILRDPIDEFGLMGTVYGDALRK